MSKSNFLGSLFGKKQGSTNDKGKAPGTVISTSHSGPGEESGAYGREAGPKVAGVAPQEVLPLDEDGLILLNKDLEQQSPKPSVDVVAVHGLGGSAFKTWTHDNGKLWLRDFLPEDLPGARVFTYGYNSTFVFSRETGTLRSYARALLEDIRCERKLPEERTRPLIFICHSMGGIIVKQALIIARNEFVLYPGFNASVSGVLFLGTPHQGSPSATYASILSQIVNIFVVGPQISRLAGPMRTELLQSLRTNEKELLNIAQDFRVHTDTLQIASFIEQKNMRGLNERIVDEKSGLMGAPTERLVPMPDCDHREICKQGGKKSNYKKLLNAIDDCIRGPQSDRQRLQGISTTIAASQRSVTAQSDQNHATFHTSSNVSNQAGTQVVQGGSYFCGNKDLLSKLPHVEDAAFNSYTRQHDSLCLPRTRVGLLNQIIEWSNNTHGERIFWLSGLAGTGKSTIARTVARKLDNEERLGASFFFSKGHGDLGHAAKLFTTIAFQLANVFPALTDTLNETLAKRNLIARQTLRDQWKHLIYRPLSMLEDSQRRDPFLVFTLVIDALDECESEDDVRIILQLFTEVKDLCNIRFSIFITSRPEIPIRLGFRDMPEILHQDLILHNIPRSIIEHDISVFVRHELGIIREHQGLSLDWPNEKDVKLLIQKSDCLFIYVATVCRFIDNYTWPSEERLSLILYGDATNVSPTAKLDNMYIQVLKSSVIKNCKGQEKARLSKRFRQIVGSIVTLFDVLSVTSLAGLLSKEVRDVDMALSSIHSILNIPERKDFPVQLHHPTFRDFLLDDKRCPDGDFRINPEVAHTELAKSCLGLLSNTLTRDICSLGMPGTLVHGIESEKINSRLPKHVQYACRYWIDHLERVSPLRRNEIGLYDDGQVHNFIKKHFLHWLEALSLMGKMSEGVLMITKLESMLELDRNPILRGVAYDAKRFVLYFRSIIEEAPLQLYTSALVFSPKQSLIRKCHLDQSPAWIERLETVEENWSPSLQTLEGHTSPVVAIAFSPDGQLLASGSEDGTVRLWDPNTGVARGTLEGHTSEITALVFSSNSQLLASSCNTTTVRLWDPKIGVARGTFEGYTKSHFIAMTFSLDGQLLISNSDHNTVQLWDPKTGAAYGTLKGHTDRIIAMAFSPNGQSLASSSYDSSVRLWDLNTGVARAIFEGYTDVVVAIAFSPDGQLLASGSEDATVRLWDPNTGATRGILRGHTQYICAIAFSPDGQLLASSCNDHTFRLWDPKKGVARGMLKGHTSQISAIMFSPNGQLLASGSCDGTVRLWDPKREATCGTHEDHIDSNRTVAVSPDGQLLASASYNGTVRIWDLKTRVGVTRGRLSDISEPCKHIVFSPNGQLLACSSRITIWLWDSKTGAARGTLEGHTGRITAMAFSPNGQLLASSSWISHDNNSTVQLWDPKKGVARGTLKGHTDHILAIAFSSDGQLLACSSRNTVGLWDSKTRAQLQQFDAQGVTELSFSTDLSYIQTNCGQIQLTQSPSTSFSPWMINGNWLTYYTAPFLWLPPEFRPHTLAARGSLYVMGCSSERIIFLRLDSNSIKV